MHYTLAKLQKSEDSFMNAFGMGGPTKGLDYFCTEIFESEEEARLYVSTTLQPELDKRADNTYDKADTNTKLEWDTAMNEDDKVCLHSEQYVIVPLQGVVEILGKPQSIRAD